MRALRNPVAADRDGRNSPGRHDERAAGAYRRADGRSGGTIIPEIDWSGRLRVEIHARVQSDGRMSDAAVEDQQGDTFDVGRRRIGIQGDLGRHITLRSSAKSKGWIRGAMSGSTTASRASPRSRRDSSKSRSASRRRRARGRSRSSIDRLSPDAWRLAAIGD